METLQLIVAFLGGGVLVGIFERIRTHFVIEFVVTSFLIDAIELQPQVLLQSF